MALKLKHKPKVLHVKGVRPVSRPSFGKPYAHKRGRREWMPTETDLRKIREAAGRGLTRDQIANALGISLSTLVDHASGRYGTDAEAIQEALDRGRALGIDRIARALFQEAEAGNVTAQIFLMKNLAQWRSEPKDDPIPPGGPLGTGLNPVTINVQFTKPLKVDKPKDPGDEQP